MRKIANPTHYFDHFWSRITEGLLYMYLKFRNCIHRSMEMTIIFNHRQFNSAYFLRSYHILRIYIVQCQFAYAAEHTYFKQFSHCHYWIIVYYDKSTTTFYFCTSPTTRVFKLNNSRFEFQISNNPTTMLS